MFNYENNFDIFVIKTQINWFYYTQKFDIDF